MTTTIYPVLPDEIWEPFIERLEGPDGCNFHTDDTGRLRWTCDATENRPIATAILLDLGIAGEALEDTLERCAELGGYCDCEIIFNVARHFVW